MFNNWFLKAWASERILSAFDRIQQLQLLGRQDMTGDARDRLWSQLEAEILVQRHKTVMRAVRQRDHPSPPHKSRGCVRTVTLRRGPDQGLGISITVREIFATITSFLKCLLSKLILKRFASMK